MAVVPTSPGVAAGFYEELSAAFFGSDERARPSPSVSAMSSGVRRMLVGLKGACDCIQALPETDFSDDLRSVDEEG
jgi:non-heme chloroperoxidase